MDNKALFRILAEKAGDSTWRELGKEALKTAVNTLIEEGIEATVEIWKKRRLKIQEEFLENRDFDADEQTVEPPTDRDRQEYPAGDGDEPADFPEEGGEETDRAAGEQSRMRSSRARIEGFGAFVDKQS